MLSVRLAAALRDAGLGWKPVRGDRFVLPDRDMDDEIFVLSDMTVELHELPEGQVIGFNGTTEWALDDVHKDEVLWLPREDQLRGLLGRTFQRLDRVDGQYRVVATIGGDVTEVRAADPEEAYGEALLRLIAYASAGL
ncbi:MAG TPA: pilus assembly protein CpaE [Rugosimonospora sp.]|nr:pilus assembly protein CpaE [Rugosimonospora sp.]